MSATYAGNASSFCLPTPVSARRGGFEWASVFESAAKSARAATGNQNRSIGAARECRNAEVTVQSKDTIRLNLALKIYRRTHSRFPYVRSFCVRALHSVRGSPAVISAIRKPSSRSIRSFVTNGFFLPLSISFSFSLSFDFFRSLHLPLRLSKIREKRR